MITRKGFIASIGAALTGAASKASSPAGLAASSEPPPLNQLYFADAPFGIMYDPYAELNNRTRITIGKLKDRSYNRARASAWLQPGLCTPEDFRKRWALLKGYKTETHTIDDHSATGWWKAEPDDFRSARNLPKNIQGYKEYKNAQLKWLKEYSEKILEKSAVQQQTQTWSLSDD